jgi:TRAP-type uncharacterized transport system substrate-binding protein
MRFFSVRLTNALTWMCLTLGISSSTFAAAPVNLTISTGSVSGVYYPAGGAICRLLNKSQKQHQLRCSVTASEGSIANIQKLRNNVANAASDFYSAIGRSHRRLDNKHPKHYRLKS